MPVLLAAALAAKSSEAQTESALWNRLKLADSRIRASQTIWLETTTVAPSPLSEQEVQNMVASTREQGKKRHLTDAQIEALVKKFVAGARRHAQGFTRTHTMAFLHRGQTTRCDVFTETKAYFAIDYYDGTNIVSLIGFDKDPNSGVKPNQGTLVRGEEPLPYSAIRPADLLFLVGQPVTEVFHPQDSKLQRNSDGSVTLEKTQKWQQLDCLLRLRLSPENLRPVSLDCIIKGTSELLLRWSAGREKPCPGGVNFPEEFKVEAFDGAQQVTLTENYKLIKGAFNQAADLTELRVPPGSIIDDLRFGQAHSLSYTLDATGLLPTDEKVRDLLKKQGRPVDDAVEDAQAAPTQAQAPPVSLSNSPAPANG